MSLAKDPKVSIVMPTFNSERTIELSLRSVRGQEYPQDQVEILVVDGGSTDRTLDIARAHGARVLPNPKVQQEFAKHIGLGEALGRYAVFLDSDEVLENPRALKNRVDAFQALPDVRVVLCGGYRKPAGASSVNDYINIFSDPFAWFMYGTTSDDRSKIASWSSKYRVDQDGPGYVVYRFDGPEPLPLVDFCAGNSVDLEWLRQEFAAQWGDHAIVPRLFYLMMQRSAKAAILKDDPIVHHSADSYYRFVKKLKWRAVVNVHYPRMPGTGFANRQEFQPRSFRLKKYLFIPYAFSGGPALTSVVQLVRTRNPAALAHLPLTLATASLILYSYGMKLAGLRPRLKTYGGGEKDLAL
jgi:glycosyltransferase involved in cell wall biosynthesis